LSFAHIGFSTNIINCFAFFLKASAKFCKRMLRNKIQPDYPKESLGLYLDFLNLFAAMGGSGE
jgi:hypothetical protein